MIPQVKVGQEIPLKIKRLGINGEGIGYYKRQAIFVKGALVDEEYSIMIDEVLSGYAIGHPVRSKSISNKRVKPFCPLYGKCGGCNLQHLSYESSLEAKRDLVIEAINRYSGVDPKSFEIKHTIGLDDPFGYRNKSSLPVCFDGEKTVLGIYEVETNKVVYIDDCPVQNQIVNKVNSEVLKLIDKHHVFAFNEKTKKGHLRYLVTRVGASTKEVQVTFITYQKMDLSRLANDTMEVDGVESVYSDFNNDLRSHSIFGNHLKHLAGKKTIKEALGNYIFELMPNAFFQLNPIQTVKLYDLIKKSAHLSRTDNVLDAYSGVGTIGIWIAESCKKVVGIESNAMAVNDAKCNAQANNIKNIEFIQGEVSKVLPKLVKEGFKPDVVLVDPPRTGLGNELINVLLKESPRKIIYTSCNPSTLAKDLKILSSKYKISFIQPIDMFPFTSNVECVAHLILKNPK